MMQPLSCVGQWRTQLCNPEFTGENTFIKDLPFEIMNLLFNKIKEQPRWENWKKCIALEFKTKKTVNIQFLVRMMLKRNYKLKDLLRMAARIYDLSVKECFYIQGAFLSIENERSAADQDLSRGYLKDIAFETLKELADLIEEAPSWKRMGDGLGFNFYTCHQFLTPREMLRIWLVQFPEGTLSRIYFEAKRLNYDEVCQYISEIPLEKKSAMLARDPHAFNPESRQVTIFDMDRLDQWYGLCGIIIDWNIVSFILFNSYFATKDDIWLSGNVNLAQLRVALNCSYGFYYLCYEMFLREKQFEPKNLAGITYNQMAFLAEVIACDSQMCEGCFGELINQNIPSCSFRVYHLSIRHFYCLYWQTNRELDLTQFYNKTINLLSPSHPSTTKILSYAYEAIHPMRYHHLRVKF